MPAKQQPSDSTAFKHLFGKALLERTAVAIAKVRPGFNRRSLTEILPELEKLEMKDRVRHIRDRLRKELPEDYLEALRILLASTRNGALRGFDLWPYTAFVQEYGLEHPRQSLDALAELTSPFTSEWAVRPFLRTHQKLTLRFLMRCAGDKNTHLRRWASEGSRPRLPWGERLYAFIEDPSLTLPILERLKYDDELYVRKSVANHLNDISKDHPQLVLKILSGWARNSPQKHRAKIDWIIQRALRSMIKAGNAKALKLIGVSSRAEMELVSFEISRRNLTLGERLDLNLVIESRASNSHKVVIDYLIHYVRANQSLSPKVFKLKTITINPGERVTVSKSHHLKEVTTRRHYPGKHLVEIQVNGVPLKRIAWTLKL